MLLKNLDIKGKMGLAPMSGINDLAFRMLCKDYGASLVSIGLISSDAISRENLKTDSMLTICQEERPISIQLFGTNEDTLIRSLKIAEKKADIIDFNAGCPDSKIMNQGCGAKLLDNPDKLIKIVKVLRKNTTKPLTIKLRIGNKSVIDLVKLAKMLEIESVDGIIVHPRTASQKYMGRSDWEVIKEVKSSVKIPVIGNGDVNSLNDSDKMIKLTN